jgi:hypothetical protein
LKDQKIDAHQSLVHFNHWITKNKFDFNFNYAFGVTKYDIINDISDYDGLGYTFGICNEK